jgi:AcrR family transcriptional regulator
MSSEQTGIKTASPRAARQGRPRRLSHGVVLDAALEELDGIEPEAFTLATLADRLGVSTMSLYTYYPSRETLLEAVAERAFALFAAPPWTGAWREDVLAWLWSVQRHVERHPIAIKVMAWNGRVPAAWLRVWSPLLGLMQAQGLEGPTLALTFDWFINAAIGLIVAQRHAIEASKTASVGDVGALPSAEGLLLVRLFYDLQSLGREARYEIGFRRLIEGLDASFAEARAGAP